MKRTILLSFLVIYLLSITELQQILKLPVLVEHFSEHQKIEKKIPFWKFLCLHYPHETVKYNDFDKDTNLPIKNTNRYNSSNHFTILSELKFNLNTTITSSNNKVKSKYYNRFTNSIFLKSIWQPPKLT